MEMTIAGWQISIERRPFTTQELRERYDEYASQWHRSIKKQGYVSSYRELAGRLSRQSPSFQTLPNEIELLDNGIGTAALSLGLADSLPAQVTVSGVDFSSEMLMQARATLASAGHLMRGYQRDAQSLGFADQQFDMVVSAHLLEHLEDPAGAINEMSRVLKPGSPMLLVVSKPTFYTQLLQAKWRFNAFAAAEMVRMMQAAGLENVQTLLLSGARPRLSSHAFLATKPAT